MGLALLLALGLLQAEAAVPRVGQWEVFELSMTARSHLSNAYVDGLPARDAPLARVTFSSGKQQYTLAAFWDGGRKWTVRFAPPLPGVWTYASSSRDAGLEGVRGSLTCSPWTEAEKQANPARRGFIEVARRGPRAGRYFQHADGTPFLWIGDTWWAWARKGIRIPSFQKLADDRAAKGFSVGQIYFSGDGWLMDAQRESPDLDQIRHVERFIRYANSKGITVWVHPWWARKEMSQNPGAEKIRRWCRYMVHRLCAYNVIWVLAGEYNMHDYGGMHLDFWKDLGAAIRAEDPYRRIIGAHPTPPGWQGGDAAPQWSTGAVLHREPWLDYNQSQVGHGRWRNEMIPLIVASDYARRPAKPVVVTEPWYEFVNGNPPAEAVRFGAWSALLSGAAGHTYGGGHVWWAHVPEAPADQGNWPLERGFETNTLDYPGAVSIGFLAQFLKGLEWWKLEPRPDLVSDYPAKYCAAEVGRQYLIYLRWGGAVKVDLRGARNQSFRYRWIDLTEGREGAGAEVAGGGWRLFQTPENYPGRPFAKDWLLHIRRVGEPQ